MQATFKTFLILLAAAFLFGCASGPKYSEMSSKLSKPAPDTGRIYIYRTAVLGAAVQPEVRINGEAVGSAVPNGFFYVDRKPGDYKVETSTEVNRNLSFKLEKGQIRYVRLNISMGFFVGHVYPELVDHGVGSEEIKQCSYTGK